MIHVIYSRFNLTRTEVKFTREFTIQGSALDFAAMQVHANKLGLHGWERTASWIGGPTK